MTGIVGGSSFTPLSKILAEANGKVFFECPACGIPHGINCGLGQGPVWKFNMNVDAPTFYPSILVEYRAAEPPATEENLDMIMSGEIVQVITDRVCHSFVTDGKIKFLKDCTHHLADQTVDIPDWDVE